MRERAEALEGSFRICGTQRVTYGTFPECVLTSSGGRNSYILNVFRSST